MGLWPASSTRWSCGLSGRKPRSRDHTFRIAWSPHVSYQTSPTLDDEGLDHGFTGEHHQKAGAVGHRRYACSVFSGRWTYEVDLASIRAPRGSLAAPHSDSNRIPRGTPKTAGTRTSTPCTRSRCLDLADRYEWVKTTLANVLRPVALRQSVNALSISGQHPTLPPTFTDFGRERPSSALAQHQCPPRFSSAEIVSVDP